MSSADVVHLSINACTNCRRLHKKCDKQLPSCARCSRNNKCCSYNNVGKRGPKSSSDFNQPYPAISVHKVVPRDKNILNSFDGNLQDLPFLPKERLFRAIIYVEQEWTGQQNLDEPPDKDDLALMYSIKAVILKAQSQTEQAQVMFEKGKSLIMNRYDQILRNFILAACSLFLGTYCMIDNDIDRATFFLENVRSFFEKNGSADDPSVKMLRILYDDISGMIIGDTDMERTVKRLIAQNYTVKEFLSHKTQESTSKILVAQSDADVGFRDIEKIQTDLSMNTNHYELTNERIFMLSAKFNDMFDRMVGIVSADAIEMKKFSTSMCLQGVIVQRGMRYGHIDSALQAADFIAYSTTTPLFEKCYLSLGPVVSLAANVHLYCYCLFRDVNARGGVLDCLSLELKALTMIRDKNKMVGAGCEDMIQNISYVLRSAEENIMTNNLYFQMNRQQSVYDFGQTMNNFMTAVSCSQEFMGCELVLDQSSQSDEAALDAIDKFFQDFVE
jgi:hypothetical protein